MISLLIAVIYLVFISLGLPDSLLGSAWPVIHNEFNVPLSYMGLVTIIISGCTIISSLFADKLNRKFKTQIIVLVSILLTVIGLFGFSLSTSFYMLLLFAIPYGLGAGAIDSSLNNYVALHFSSRHMSWLHCFWGVGTIISPYIMSYSLSKNSNWHQGYRIVSYLQLGIALVVLSTLFLWNKSKNKKEDEEVIPASLTFKQKFKIPGLFFIIFGFLGYCAMESTFTIWTSTFLVEARSIDTEKAAALASFFYIGLTLSRFLAGFVSNKLGDKNLIRIGIGIVAFGIICISIPVKFICLTGFIIVGFGCGPIYPSIIHSTPNNFGKENSQAIIGLQMAAAYTGSTFMPPLFGIIANNISIKLFPIFAFIFLLLSLIMTELLNKMVKKRNQKSK